MHFPFSFDSPDRSKASVSPRWPVVLAVAFLCVLPLTGTPGVATDFDDDAKSHLKVKVAFGQQSMEGISVTPRLIAGSPGLEVTGVTSELDPRGRVAAVIAEVSWKPPSLPPREVHSIWKYLLENGDPGQVRRLKDDPGLQPDAPVLTVQLSSDGTEGFSIGLDQLARHKAMWLPDHDALITLADEPVDFKAHLASLKGDRVLDQVKRARKPHWPNGPTSGWTSVIPSHGTVRGKPPGWEPGDI